MSIIDNNPMVTKQGQFIYARIISSSKAILVEGD